MANVLTLTFNGASVENDFIEFYVTDAGVTSLKRETFKPVREIAGEASIGLTANEQASLYASAFEADYAGFSVVVLSNVVTIVNRQGLDIFGVSTPDNVTFTLNALSLAVTGLASDRYLINNPIIVDIGSGVFLDYFKVVLNNLTTGKTSTDIIVHPSPSGYATINLAAHIKGMFDMPGRYVSEIGVSSSLSDVPTKNANTFEITVTSPSNPEISPTVITKTFIRGGRRTTATNQVLANNSAARPQARLPIWSGYTASAYVVSGNQVVKRPLANIPEAVKDYRRAKGCNEVYLEFANQQGGYSNWLFESHEDTHANDPLGTFYNGFRLSNLGSESVFTRKLYGKIPQEYIELIRDLIDSPEVYYYTNSRNMEMCTVAKNTITFDKQKTGYFVTLNINLEYQFNPSLLWSN